MKPQQLKYYITFLVLGIIAGLFIYNRYIEDPDNVIEVRYDSIIYKIDSVFTPIPYEVIEYVDKVKTVYKTDTFTIDLTQPVDSAQILADYTRTRLYRDTIRDDLMVAYITDSIQFNRLKTRQFSYKILRPTHVVESNSIGIGVGYYGTLFPYVYYNHNKWYFSAGYNKELYLGVGYNLFSF